MSMHLNANSKSNQSGSGFQNNDHQVHDHDGPSFSLHSSFGDLNHSNGSGSSTTTANTNPHVGSRPIISSLSQLGLSKRVTHEVRTSYVAPHRVHVHSVIDFMPVQNQTSDLPLTEVTVTHEIVRTQLLAATSSKDRIFNIPRSDDDEIRIQGQPSIQTQTLPLSSNQLNHSMSFQRSEPLHDHHFQNPSNNFAHFQTSNSRHDHPSLGSHLQNPGYYNPSHYQNAVPMETKDQNPSHANPPLIIRNISSRELRFYLESNISNPLRSYNYSVDTDISEDEDDEIEGDGRTHSLPYKKYGPYTCPKCEGVFDTSQSFAAHIGSHYKYETSEERRKRLAARRRSRKNLRLFRFGAGLTVVPDYSLNTAWQRKTWNVHENAEMAVKSEERDDGDEELDDEEEDEDEGEDDEDDGDEMQKQAPIPPEPEAAKAGLIGNEIKKELLELMV